MSTLSIIIPVKQNLPKIIKTFESLEPLLGDIELVIHDWRGESNIKINHPFVKLSQDDDTGTSDACNQAVALTNSNYLMFWGAGEVAMQNGLRKALSYVGTNSPSLVFNPILVQPVNQIAFPIPETIRQGMQCLMPGVIMKTDLFHAVGGLDTSYKSACDYDLMVKILKINPDYVKLTDPVVEFITDGMTSIGSGVLEGALECELIKMRHYLKPSYNAALDLSIAATQWLKQYFVPFN